ncbi:MAG: dephospho-CoA kinase [Desulfuromonadales bacterium]|nr:dephospho-CoA kinase [Desulfuromonadales bacterium]
MRKKSLILGITGGIASGKSLVAAEFARLGAALVSADQLAREVVAPGSSVLNRLVERFGGGILGEDGSLDRATLARIVFAEERARADLSQIVHPAIGRLALERLRERAQSSAPLVVYEAPLLFEAGAEGRVDRVLVVKVDPQVQLQRLIKRDGLTPADASRRVAAQLSQQAKLARADYVIDNSGSIADTVVQVERLWQVLVEAAG